MSLASILSEFGSLGPSWDHLGTSKVNVCIPSFILEDFSSKGAPRSEPKSHIGGFQMGIGACYDVFSKGLFQDLHFTPNQVPKTDSKKDAFLGPLDMAET